MIDAKFVDFHCHLDLHKDMEASFKRCEEQRCITYTVTTTPKAFERNKAIANSTEYIKAALGLHPQLVSKRASEVTLFDDLIKTTRFIGEVGLDATRAHYSSFNMQQEVFSHILNCCSRHGDKIISVHSARCAKKVLDSIEHSGVSKNCKIVLHWFSASNSEIRRATELGCWFSVNEKMLEAKSGRELIHIVPSNRVLTETDAPFIFKQDVSNFAGDVQDTVKILSMLYNRSEKQIQESMVRNAENILAN